MEPPDDVRDSKLANDLPPGTSQETNDTLDDRTCTQNLDVIKKSVSQIYIKERKAGNKVDPQTRIYPIFEEAIKLEPTNVDLWIEYIVTMERNEEPLSRVVGIFEKGLCVEFKKGEQFRSLWFTYIDFLRRHTNWDKQEDVDSLDRSFDVCAQYLSRIPGADPELSLLKYWALIQAKYLKNIDGARKIWDDISRQQGLEYAKTAKFWMDFVEFERLFGGDNIEQYRKLLYRALQQTNDFPELIGERLIRFERQEGESVEKVVEAQRRLNQAIARINVRRKKEEELEAERREKRKSIKRLKKMDKVKTDRRPSDSGETSPPTDLEIRCKKAKTENISDYKESEQRDTPCPVSLDKKPQRPFIPRTLLTKKKS